MSLAITLEVLPALFGDCLLVECHREGRRPWRALIDGGPADSWPSLRSRLERLPASDPHLDLVVVTHIDHDHIGSLLPFFEQGVPGLTIGEVWFNGLPQLPDPDSGQARSVAEGESLVSLLTGRETTEAPRWNTSFAGSAVMTAGQGAFLELRIPEGPTLTLLSPTPKRLGILRNQWVETLNRLQRGESSDEEEPPAPLDSLTDLSTLAGTETPVDRSAPNGSSIAFLLEHRGASCLLAADAFPNVLGAGLTGLARARGVPAVPVDVFKLPHHASKSNVTAKVVALAPAAHYVVSTNGEHFHHPHDVALARVVTGGPPGLSLWFNYCNERTARWGEKTLVDRRYELHARYPEPGTDGVRIELPVRSS